MSLGEVKQIINNSKFNSNLKQRLVLILPSLGKYTLDGLGKEVSRGDSLLIADYLVGLWENFAVLFSKLKNKEEGAGQILEKFLEKNLSEFNGDDEVYILYFVLDLRILANGNQLRVTTEQFQQLLDYEIRLFWKLSKDEILYLLKNHILFLLQKLDLVLDVQVAVYKNEWDFYKDFSKNFSNVLLQNQELLSGKEKKSIGEWIRDYINFTSPTKSQASMVGVA